MIVPKIVKVDALEDLKIQAQFENGEIKILDIKPYLNEFPIFKNLLNENLFKKVHVDCNGFAIAWNDDIDLSRYDVYEFGV